MVIQHNKAENIQIAYIGGGSRGWAWGLMSDLAAASDISGEVRLYDIDREAASHNEIIGNRFSSLPEACSAWRYHAVDSLSEALTGADLVVISILPGTFDEMHSDVHTPEKYGIYQSVGDTTGPGGIVRAMRTIPMMEEIAEGIKRFSPRAFVINYTNPMTLCVKTLYRVFPEIRAFGCCHEVFGTQELLAIALQRAMNLEEVAREEIEVTPVGVNHFTWLTEAHYKNIDLFPLYEDFAEQFAQTGFTEKFDENWMNNSFVCSHKVKFDLFRRYGYIAAAGDRHLAEFCPGNWYLSSPQKVREWGFGLTTVTWRKEDLTRRLQRSEDIRSGRETLTLQKTGEEGVNQLRALLGLGRLVTNVNLPNMGQIENLPLGAVVETNAVFGAGTVKPVMSGAVPVSIHPLVSRICSMQEALSDAVARRNVNDIFAVFANDPLVNCSLTDAKALFREMTENTKAYLGSYDLGALR